MDANKSIAGALIGAAIFRSPEAIFQRGIGPATDIWSFGAMVGLPTIELRSTPFVKYRGIGYKSPSGTEQAHLQAASRYARFRNGGRGFTET